MILNVSCIEWEMDRNRNKEKKQAKWITCEGWVSKELSMRVCFWWRTSENDLEDWSNFFLVLGFDLLQLSGLGFDLIPLFWATILIFAQIFYCVFAFSSSFFFWSTFQLDLGDKFFLQELFLTTKNINWSNSVTEVFILPAKTSMNEVFRK